MRSAFKEKPEYRTCPEHVAAALLTAGGTNRFDEPMFRVVWGWNRIVPVHGQWEEWEQVVVTLTDRVTGYKESRQATRLKSSVVETRLVPKYLPGNCWHLEMWRPPEEYGSPEDWGKLGEEVVGCMTIDTAGLYPSRGEYELCYPLTSDGTSHGEPVILVADVVSDICRMIVVGKERHSFQQRRAAIEQRERRAEEGFMRVTMDRLKDGLRPFAGEKFVTVPNQQA